MATMRGVCHRIGECDHLGAVDVVEVEDVLASHHPAADHAVPDGVAHAPTVLRHPAHRSVRELFRRAALASSINSTPASRGSTDETDRRPHRRSRRPVGLSCCSNDQCATRSGKRHCSRTDRRKDRWKDRRSAGRIRWRGDE
jgi:hypothetical protein